MIDPPQQDQDRAAGCIGKHRFDNPQKAHEVAEKARHRVEVYRCRFCGGWHIGG